MKLLIADDEPRTVRGLRGMVERGGLGITSVLSAANGIEALDIMGGTKIDILLADIGMPLMDGIELARRVKAEYPHTRIVFVTGHADVDYMRSAFKSSAVDYLLKPIDPEELHNTLDSIVQGLAAEAAEGAYLARVEAQLHQSLPALREKFFLGLLGGNVPSPAAIEEKLRLLQLNIPEGALFATLAITEDSKDNGQWKEGHALLAVAVANIAEEKLAALPMGYCFEQPGGYVCILALPPATGDDWPDMPATSTEERLEAIARDLQSVLREVLHIETSIGVGVWVDAISDLPLSYTSARQAAARRLVLGPGRVILGSNTGIHKAPYAKVDFTYYSSINTAIVNGDEAQALKVARDVFHLIRSDEVARPLRVANICNTMVLAIGSAVQESIEYTGAELERREKTESQVRGAATLDEMERAIEAYISWAVKRIQSVSSETQESVVDKIKSFIAHNYAQEITLNTLAREVYLSPAYLCLLFKQETGTTLVSYLSSLRIEKAKQLLADPARTLTAVSGAVGFNDPKYFSRVFKRYTGYSPTEYRTMRQEEKDEN